MVDRLTAEEHDWLIENVPDQRWLGTHPNTTRIVRESPRRVYVVSMVSNDVMGIVDGRVLVGHIDDPELSPFVFVEYRDEVPIGTYTSETSMPALADLMPFAVPG